MVLFVKKYHFQIIGILDEDNILALSNQQIDSLDGPLKSMYAVATFNQYVARYHYNKGVLFANTADSLIRADDQENYQSYLDSACFHFSEALNPFLDTFDEDIQRAGRFCSGLKVEVNLANSLDAEIAEQVRLKILDYGFPAFTGNQREAISQSELRYFYAQDSTNAQELFQMIQDSFAFGDEMDLIPPRLGLSTDNYRGTVEVWIGDGLPPFVNLFGRIVNLENNNPIHGAKIRWRDLEIISNLFGEFSMVLSRPIPNQINLQITATDYESKQQNFNTNNSNLGTIALVPIPERVPIAIKRKVVDQNTQSPIANASIKGQWANLQILMKMVILNLILNYLKIPALDFM